MTKQDIDILLKEVLEVGNWMLRRSDGGIAYGGFRWNEVGEWTEAHDFVKDSECGHGLHGNGPSSSGYWADGKDVDFCEVDSVDLVDLGDKVKCLRARILLRNEIPEGLEVGGNLYLSNTPITELPEGLKVGGSLDFSYTSITEIPEGLKVGEWLDISNTPITEIPKGLKVGGRVYR